MSDVAQPVRIGVIGAGAFTRQRHIPKLREITGVEILAVCNRTPETVRQVAREFSIPHAYTDWRQVIARPDLDAILVGTPPYLHHQATLAALAAGKHVLCEGRMATSLREAREMLQQAQASGLKTMLVRTSFCLKGQRFIKRLLEEGYVGRVRQVFGHWLVPSYANSSAPLHWRQDARVSGAINPLFLSPFWEVFRPWFGDASRVLAHSATFARQRPQGEGGPLAPVEVPDAVNVVAEMESGAVVTMLLSGVALFGQNRVEIYGDQGTLVYSVRTDEVLGARLGDEALRVLLIPPELEETWQVEADFVRLVRGELPEGRPTFADGVKYTEFTEAALLSAHEGRWVTLPLP
ncbi:MAG: Gfo/Idh/MocA family oxidoreductase [Chloroflexi bacterium]|nr:Gfo/Idh/MocA family oxidoreductase [Chloroflexota bacterium]